MESSTDAESQPGKIVLLGIAQESICCGIKTVIVQEWSPLDVNDVLLENH